MALGLAVALMAATASLASPPAVAAAVRGAVPVTFEPGTINRTPGGGPVPEGTAPTMASMDKVGEVVESRDERTRTFRTADGKFRTEFSDGPVNYRDAAGNWQPIDNTLVRAAEPGYALRNAAGRLSVVLPTALDKAPVRVADDAHSVAFSLKGASGTPTVD